MHAVYYDSWVSVTGVYRLIKEFLSEKSHSNPVDGRRRLFSARDERNIAQVKAFVEGNPNSTARELSNTCGLSISMVHLILYDDLHVKKIVARCVPNLLTDEQKVEC